MSRQQRERGQAQIRADTLRSPWPKRALCQAAWAASHTRNAYFSAQFRRLAVRRGKKRAIIAVAHSLLRVVHWVLKQNCPYRGLGGNYFDRLHANRHKRYFVKKLDAVGFQVNLAPSEHFPFLFLYR